MNYELEISYSAGIVRVYMAGDDDYATCRETFSKIKNACDHYQCYKILGIQKMTPLKVTEAYDVEKIFRELGLSMAYSIAWVEQESAEAREMLEYSAAVLRNKHLLNGGIFANEDDALQWLLQQR